VLAARRAAASGPRAREAAVNERARRRSVLLALGLALGLALLAAVLAGSVPLPSTGVLRSLLARAGLVPASPLSAAHETILWSVRLPRALLAALVGGGLAVVGASLQAVFKNPMADSGLLGVGSGAALGALVAVRLGWSAQVFFALPMAAFAGALLAILCVYVIAHAGGRPSLHGLLLTGLAVSALASAGASMLLVMTEEFRVKTVLFWLAGGLEGRGWTHVQLGATLILAGSFLVFVFARPLDLLSLAALIAGAATAVAGSVPFVGLVAPHALRPVVGPRGRHLLPAAFLGGAVLVVLADLAARTISDRLDLPLGSLTAFVGAPYFLFALRGSEDRA